MAVDDLLSLLVERLTSSLDPASLTDLVQVLLALEELFRRGQQRPTHNQSAGYYALLLKSFVPTEVPLPRPRC